MPNHTESPAHSEDSDVSLTDTGRSVADEVGSYVKSYGPFGFGMASLLILWSFIMKPQLDRQALDFDANRKIIEQLNIIVTDQKEVSANLKQAATILERLVKKTEPQ